MGQGLILDEVVAERRLEAQVWKACRAPWNGLFPPDWLLHAYLLMAGGYGAPCEVTPLRLAWPVVTATAGQRFGDVEFDAALGYWRGLDFEVSIRGDVRFYSGRLRS